MKIPKELYKEILETFMPSKTMKEYLKDVELEEWQILQLICGAPVSLGHKLAHLYHLQEYHEWFAQEYRDTKAALQELEHTESAILYLKEKWYDTDDWMEKGSGIGPFTSEGYVVSYLYENELTDLESWKSYTENGCWSEVEKWVRNGEEFEHTYTYFLLWDNVCYYEKEGPYIPFEKPFSRVADSMNLNLPTPFKPGDIVITDSLPFAPQKLAVITEIMDNRDCCSLQAISRNHKNEYTFGAVKHGRIYGGDNASIAYSPLYHIEKFTGELPAEDQFLSNISRYINGKEEKGRRLWEKLRLTDKVPEERIKEKFGE